MTQEVHLGVVFGGRRSVRRGKLEVVREGGEESALGGGNGEDLPAAKAEWDEMQKAKGMADDAPLWAKSALTVNAKGNAIDHLTMAVRTLVELRNNPYAWKWALISLHSAIYGFAVCAAASDDGGMNILEKGRLLSFWRVLEICQDEEWMGRLITSKPLVLSDKQRKAVEYLCNNRNRMAHFPPNVHVRHLPDWDSVIHCLEVIQAIALGTGTVPWKSDEKKNIAALCKAGIALARNYIIPADEE